MSRPLFRAEALQGSHRDGGAALRRRMPWRGLAVLLACLLPAALIAFALVGQYTRKEHVAGYLAPTAGLIKISAPQGGTVSRLAVSEGQSVRRGDVLMVVSSERSSASAREAQAASLRELQQRRDSLRQEQGKQGQIDALAGDGAQQRLRGLEQQAAQLQQQLALQRARVASAERTIERQSGLVAAGFIAEAALQRDQEALMDQRNQLAALLRNASALDGDIAAARTELAALPLRRINNVAAIARQISELDQQLGEADARRTLVLTATADGTVTTVLVGEGQTAAAGAPLLTILPAGAALQAQLLVPTRAAGFIRPGQEVALRYQAFPYQRFGHHTGTVLQVGRSVLQPNETSLPLPVQEPVYRVTVSLPAQQVRAYGEPMALQAGMLLDADVAIDRRSILQWIVDPLLSVTGRV